MKCPLCGCEKFYVKDQEDEYTTYCFSCSGNGIVFELDSSECNVPDITEITEISCDRCAWHGKLEDLKNRS